MIRRSSIITLIILTSFVIPAGTMGQNPPVYTVARVSFNSSAFNDISPVIVEDGLVFCSDRRFSGIMDRTSFDGRRLFNIYMAERKDAADWKKPGEIKSERSKFFNNGPLCFAPDGKTVYFTSEIETGQITRRRDFVNRSGIFIADRAGMELTSIRPFKYNNSEYDIGQPSISSDGRFLFFASDMPGGHGRSDIYYCELINGEWGSPVNIGPEINSPSLENYPFIHSSGRLYFTSNRPGGPGGMDVYYSIMSNGKWEPPVLLPEPVNSSSDDFAFVAYTDLQSGFFSSNRRRTDDIYEFKSAIIRKASCDSLLINNYCYEFLEVNAVKFDTMPFRYEWKFGDGHRCIGPVVEHCYAGPGTYLVQLDVVNLVTNEVLYNEKSDILEVTDYEQPYISGSDSAFPGQELHFSADSTNLPGWDIEQFYWNFGDETVAIGKEVDKTYLKPGTFNIQLIVSTKPEPGGIVREACVCKNIIITPLP